MKKLIPYIVIILIATGVAYYLLDNKDNKFNQKIKELELVIDQKNKANDSLNIIATKLQDSVKVNEAKVVEVEKNEQAFKNTAAKYKELYKRLLLEPEEIELFEDFTKISNDRKSLGRLAHQMSYKIDNYVSDLSDVDVERLVDIYFRLISEHPNHDEMWEMKTLS